jgi:hypothetical protein
MSSVDFLASTLEMSHQATKVSAPDRTTPPTEIPLPSTRMAFLGSSDASYPLANLINLGVRVY